MTFGLTDTEAQWGSEEKTLSASKCRPDYESMISSAKKMKDAAERLRQATMDYMDHDYHLRRSTGMLTMIGHLDMKIAEAERNIARLMAEQEADKAA